MFLQSWVRDPIERGDSFEFIENIWGYWERSYTLCCSLSSLVLYCVCDNWVKVISVISVIFVLLYVGWIVSFFFFFMCQDFSFDPLLLGWVWIRLKKAGSGKDHRCVLEWPFGKFVGTLFIVVILFLSRHWFSIVWNMDVEECRWSIVAIVQIFKTTTYS
jgi:hypothetical protein